jgi:hypothetical protein
MKIPFTYPVKYGELRDAVEGDAVIVNHISGRSVHKIRSMTETTLTVDYGGVKMVFERSSGHQITEETWYFSTLVKATSDLVDEVNKENKMESMKSYLRSTNWDDFDSETLRRVLLAIKAAPSTGKTGSRPPRARGKS